MGLHRDTLPSLPVPLEALSDRDLLVRLVVRVEYAIAAIEQLEERERSRPCADEAGCPLRDAPLAGGTL